VLLISIIFSASRVLAEDPHVTYKDCFDAMAVLKKNYDVYKDRVNTVKTQTEILALTTEMLPQAQDVFKICGVVLIDQDPKDTTLCLADFEELKPYLQKVFNGGTDSSAVGMNVIPIGQLLTKCTVDCTP